MKTADFARIKRNTEVLSVVYTILSFVFLLLAIGFGISKNFIIMGIMILFLVVFHILSIIEFIKYDNNKKAYFVYYKNKLMMTGIVHNFKYKLDKDEFKLRKEAFREIGLFPFYFRITIKNDLSMRNLGFELRRFDFGLMSHDHYSQDPFIGNVYEFEIDNYDNSHLIIANFKALKIKKYTNDKQGKYFISHNDFENQTLINKVITLLDKFESKWKFLIIYNNKLFLGLSNSTPSFPHYVFKPLEDVNTIIIEEQLINEIAYYQKLIKGLVND